MDEDAPRYFDYNATTPVLPEVVDAMLPYLREHFGNPSSGHVFGVKTHKAIETARGQVADLLGCDADEIVFTSGGTESSNLAIRGTLAAPAARRSIVTTVVEHPATEQPCAWLEGQGHPVHRVGVDTDGRAKVADAQRYIDDRTALVTVMHANNETGVLQPVESIAKLAHAAGAVVHTDAAQSVGKIPVRVAELDVDLLTVAGHKLYAPKGVGALFIKRGTPLVPFARGAGHERGWRPGTENVAFIVGLGVACALAMRDLAALEKRLRELRDFLWRRLTDGVPGLRLNGHQELRLPNTLNVRFPNASGNEVLRNAPSIAASTGSACHEGVDQPSDVILAMGVDAVHALGSVRLSLGRSTSEEDIDVAATALVRSWSAMKMV